MTGKRERLIEEAREAMQAQAKCWSLHKLGNGWYAVYELPIDYAATRAELSTIAVITREALTYTESKMQAQEVFDFFVATKVAEAVVDLLYMKIAK